MKKKICLFFFALLFQLAANEEHTPPFAPLLPLDSQFPLRVSPANREQLMDGPARLEEEKERLRRLIEAHTFPWHSVLTAFGCLAFAGLALFAWHHWSKQKLAAKQAEAKRRELHDQLLQLKKNQWLEQSKFKPYYIVLTSLLLRALQKKLQINLLSLTTKEIAPHLQASSLPQPFQQEVLTILQTADQVKFANISPPQEEARQAYATLEAFVIQLRNEDANYSSH